MMSGNPIVAVGDCPAAICILLLLPRNCMSYKAESIYPLRGGDGIFYTESCLKGWVLRVGNTSLCTIFNPYQFKKLLLIHFFYLTRFQITEF